MNRIEEQGDLIDELLSATDYNQAIGLMEARRDLVDDELLRILLHIARNSFDQGHDEGAIDLCLIALHFANEADHKLRVDLMLLAAAACVRTDQSELAQGLYQQILREGDGSIFGHALALTMLGQLAEREGSIDQAINYQSAALQLAQLEESGVSDRDLLNIWMLYSRAMIDAGVDPEQALERSVGSLQLDKVHVVVDQMVAQSESPGLPFPSLAVGDRAELEAFWSRAYIRINFEISSLRSFELERIATVLREDLEISEQQPGRAGTNVLSDRAIMNLPMQRFYLTLATLNNELVGTATLLHEFVHFWNFNGSIGYYFSSLTAQQILLQVVLQVNGGVDRGEDDGVLAIRDAELLATPFGMHALQSYCEAQAKLLLFWLAWEPWGEGMALFTELDLDLTESDRLLAPLAAFLAGFPFEQSTLAGEQPAATEDQGEDGFSDIERRLLAAYTAAEKLQLRARDERRRQGYWSHICLGTAGKGNDDAYFAGYSMLHALWKAWAARCPPLANSSHFFEIVGWFTHSGFEDLVPDWTQPLGQFSRDLLARFNHFVETLFAVPAATLQQIHDDLLYNLGLDQDPSYHALSPGQAEQVKRRYDVWHFLRTGQKREGPVEAREERVDRLRREVASLLVADPDEFVNAFDEEHDRLIQIMLNNASLHLLSESDFEIRIIGDTKGLVGLGRGVKGGASGFIYVSLNEGEYERLAQEGAQSEDRTARVYQFLMARPFPLLGLSFTTLAAMRFGSELLVIEALRMYGEDDPELNEEMNRTIKHFLEPESQKGRARLARPVVDPGTDWKTLVDEMSQLPGIAGSPVVQAIADLERVVDVFTTGIARLYLRPLVPAEPAKLIQLHKERVNALLPADNFLRSRARTLLRCLSQQAQGIEREELAGMLGLEPQALDDLLQELLRAARPWGQELVSRDANIIKLIGLQQPVTSMGQ